VFAYVDLIYREPYLQYTPTPILDQEQSFMLASCSILYSVTMQVKTNKTITIFLQGLFVGLIGLSAFYYLLLFLVTGDAKHPLIQFMAFQPWMSLLIIGFGIQMGLFWLLRNGIQFNLQEKNDSKMAASTSTAVSGMAMVACCVHHVVDLLPVLGLSAAALFLSEYQKQFLIFGVLANLVGIFMMLWFVTGRAKLSIIFNSVFTKTKEVL